MATYINEAGEQVRYRRVKASVGEVADAWLEGSVPRAEYRRCFFEGRIIYDYGYHFPMGVKGTDEEGRPFVLLNGDSYSVSTSKHQGYVRGAVASSGIRHFIVPFSSLRQAGIAPEKVVPLDYEGERTIPMRRKVYQGGYDWERRTFTERSWTGEYETVDAHLLGSTLFKARTWLAPAHLSRDADGTAGGEGYFLSGLDEGAADLWRGHFLVQLPHPVITVAQAYRALKPEGVLQAEAAGMAVERQGEWFFVPEGPGEVLTALEKAERRGFTARGYILPDPDRTGHHVATRGMMGPDGRIYVRGLVRHTRKEHRQLKLSGWHEAFRNRALQSWSTGGRVD